MSRIFLDLMKEFEMRMMENGTFINQEKDTRDILKKFNMQHNKPINIVMSKGYKINNDKMENRLILRSIEV